LITTDNFRFTRSLSFDLSFNIGCCGHRRRIPRQLIAVVGELNRQRRLTKFRNEIRSTDRTRGVQREPLVDTLRVKHVVAFRYQTQRFVVFEFIQTNGALQRAFADLQLFHIGIRKDRESHNHFKIESTRRRRTTRARVCQWANRIAARIGAVAYVNGEKPHEEKRGD
jgi:hypothetical protein